MSRNPLKRWDDERKPSSAGIKILLASPIIIVFISPRRLISRPIWRLISRERRDNCRARSWLIIFSGAMRLSPRRSICLICAAPNPVVLPVILLIVGSPHFSYGQHPFLILDNRSVASEQQHPFCTGLSKEQAVKGIFMKMG